jgi:hypothetical protein
MKSFRFELLQGLDLYSLQSYFNQPDPVFPSHLVAKL